MVNPVTTEIILQSSPDTDGHDFFTQAHPPSHPISSSWPPKLEVTSQGMSYNSIGSHLAGKGQFTHNVRGRAPLRWRASDFGSHNNIIILPSRVSGLNGNQNVVFNLFMVSATHVQSQGSSGGATTETTFHSALMEFNTFLYVSVQLHASYCSFSGSR